MLRRSMSAPLRAFRDTQTNLEELRQVVFFNPDPVVGELVALTRSVADITLDAGANQLPHLLAVALFENFRE